MLAALLLPAASFSQDTKTGLKNLKSGSPKTRAAGAIGLAKGGDKAASAGLISALRAEKDPEVRMHMADAVGTIGDAAAAAELSALAKSDPSPDVRGFSCLKLGLLKDKTAVPLLKEIALDAKERDTVRLSAAGALTFHMEEAGVPAVFEALLRGESKVLKSGALDALARLKKQDSARRLIEIASRDADPDVKGAAEKLLKDEAQVNR